MRIRSFLVLLVLSMGCASKAEPSTAAVDAAVVAESGGACEAGSGLCEGVCKELPNPYFGSCGACRVVCERWQACVEQACACDERGKNVSFRGTIDGKTFEKTWSSSGYELLQSPGPPRVDLGYACTEGSVHLDWPRIAKIDVVTKAIGRLQLPGEAAPRALGEGTTITMHGYGGTTDLHLVGGGVDLQVVYTDKK